MMNTLSNHWDKIFLKTEDENLGWFENDLSETFNLLEKIPNWKESTVLLAGVGTSQIVDELYSNSCELILNDISIEALNRIKARILSSANKIQYLCQDISQELPKEISGIDIWVDRAVLHFLKSDEEINGYFENLKKVVKIGGYALFAEFAVNGVTKCAGLDITRYSSKKLSYLLGSTFDLEAEKYLTYISPSGGERPYIYALYKRIK